MIIVVSVKVFDDCMPSQLQQEFFVLVDRSYGYDIEREFDDLGKFVASKVDPDWKGGL